MTTDTVKFKQYLDTFEQFNIVYRFVHDFFNTSIRIRME